MKKGWETQMYTVGRPRLDVTNADSDRGRIENIVKRADTCNCILSANRIFLIFDTLMADNG